MPCFLEILLQVVELRAEVVEPGDVDVENFQISAVVAETKYAITDSPDGEASYLNITLDGCT